MGSNRSTYCDHNGNVNCTTCGAPISRRWTHAHTFSRKRGQVDHLCQECFDCVVIAASVILQTLKTMGIDVSSRELQAMIEGDYLAVLVQLPLMQATSVN